MKSLDKLISRFNDIQDLPVLEEMLGAYVEGTLQGTELDAILDQISSDYSLREMLNDTIETNVEDLVEANHPWDIYEGDYSYWELGLPPILSSDDIQSDDIDKKDKDILEGDSFQDEETLSLQNTENVFGDNLVKSNIVANKDRKVFGYESNENKDKFDPYIYQGQQPTCAIRSQEIILRDYGILIPQEELVAFAIQNGWYNPDPMNGGTPRDAVGNILDACGIPTLRTENATIYDIIAELRAGHRVIVSVDAEELWVKNKPLLFNRIFGEFKNKVQDTMDHLNNIQGANHALIVAGVKVNPGDPSDVRVTLIDSGTGEVCIEYKLSDFQEALEDSNSYMVSTTIPAPYQYNYETHKMEPSSFYTEYLPSISILPMELNNEFCLDESYYDKYTEYMPIYDVIGSSNDNSDSENGKVYNETSLYGSNDEDNFNKNAEDDRYSLASKSYSDDNEEEVNDDYNTILGGICDTDEKSDNDEIASYDTDSENFSEDDC